MPLLATTPLDKLCDPQGRPYFLWDLDMTLAEFRATLLDPDEDVRAYFTGKLMRQAKPDDVFTFVNRREIRALWPKLNRYLGRKREFWTWILSTWERLGA
jgi:hypothetical protein